MTWKLEYKHTSRRYIALSLILVAIVVATSIFVINRQSAAAERARNTVKTMFSFDSLPEWTRGPVNDTSLALFHTGTDGCFVYAEYKTGTVDASAQLQNWSNLLIKDDTIPTEIGVQNMTINTNYGIKHYDLHQYNIPSTKERPTMEGVEIGYLQLPAGYIKFNGNCNTLDELPQTLAALQSFKFKVDKSYEFYLPPVKRS